MSQEEFAPGYIKYNDPDNSPNVQVMGEDGKFHRAQLVAVAGIGGGGSVNEDKIIVKSDTIPVASEENYHKMYCYSGVTDSRYTHGYVYECVESDPTYDGVIGIYPTMIAFDYTKGTLVDFFEEFEFPNYTSVVNGTLTYSLSGDIWSITGKDKDGHIIFQDIKLYSQDLRDSGFVFIVPEDEYVDGLVLDFDIVWTKTSDGFVWKRIDLQPGVDVINNLTSTATDKALSANMGHELKTEIEALKQRGRYLTLWNSATGLAETDPSQSPYEYKAGDYFVVGNVAQGTNYRPSGSEYVIGVASTVIETEDVDVNDTYIYDGTSWSLLKNSQDSVTSVNGKTGVVVLNPSDIGAATAAQGAKADSAVQSIEEGTTNGTISVDGTDVEVHGLGSAAFTDSSDYATAAQGSKADSALQPGDNVSELINDADYASTTFREWNEGE